MTMRRTGLLLVAVTLGVVACGGNAHDEAPAAKAAAVEGTVHEVVVASRPAMNEVTGVAAPVAEATLSTKLMGTVTAVLVQEGAVVRAGQPLLRIDARDLLAKESQVAAGRAEAEAVLREAELHAERMRSLHADDAAPQAQLDAAETGLARARAAVESVRAAAAELSAVRDYSLVTAPFPGVVVRRMVDPGSFAAPGAPLLVVQDASMLRVSANVAPTLARRLSRGAAVIVSIEGVAAEGMVEGVVPVPGTSLYAVNVLVPNRDGMHMAGGAATVLIAGEVRESLLVPAAALVRRGSLTGVHVQDGTETQLRWVRLGVAVGDSLEVTAGLRGGERIVVPVETRTAGR
jgi:RND family efflux transporter MFP subunit